MKNFADRLTERIEALSNPTVMGLDPKLEFIPEEIVSRHLRLSSDPAIVSAEAIFEFNVKLIDAVCQIIPAIKPQFAYYEMYGIHGLETLYKTIDYAKSKGMLVIADAKRNDIGTTAEAYAQAIIGKTVLSDKSVRPMTGADAVTVNAYLGIDGIKPFIDTARENAAGLFVLVRTSNPSAGDFQDLPMEDGRPLYEKVADKVSEWGCDMIGEYGYSSVGAVVGATWPEQAACLRRKMPHTMILVPGYGAQGGDADSAAVNFDASGRGAIVNASRSLMCAYKKRSDLKPEDFQKAAYDEAIRMRDDLNGAIARIS
jgi:orotidine-5'-phosphate decarboxylase